MAAGVLEELTGTWTERGLRTGFPRLFGTGYLRWPVLSTVAWSTVSLGLCPLHTKSISSALSYFSCDNRSVSRRV